MKCKMSAMGSEMVVVTGLVVHMRIEDCWTGKRAVRWPEAERAYGFDSIRADMHLSGGANGSGGRSRLSTASGLQEGCSIVRIIFILCIRKQQIDVENR